LIPDPGTQVTHWAARRPGRLSRRLVRDRNPQTVVLTLKLVALSLLALAPIFAIAQVARDGGEPRPFVATAAGFGVAILFCWLLPRFAGAILVLSAVPLLGLVWFGISFGHAWSGEDWSATDVVILVVAPAVPVAPGAMLILAGSAASEYRLVRSHREVLAVIVTAALALAVAAGAAVSLDERGTHAAYSPAWSPDGRWIAYAGETLYSDVDRNFRGIYVLPADGGHERALTRTGWDDLAPAWSPDGSKIAFVRDLWTKAFVVVVEVETGASRRLAPALGVTPDSFPQPPSWSPDGRRIAFTGASDRSSDIFVVNADGTGLRNLTRSPTAHDHGPAWSPDGRLITFVSNRRPKGLIGLLSDDLYVVRANGDGMRRLTRTESEDERSPTWSPDGREIAFVRESHPTNVYVIHVDGNDLRRLTASAGSEVSGLAWSPDGLCVAYVGTRGGANIYVVDRTGGLPENLTYRSDDGSYNPSWSPDGRRIAFEREGLIYVMNADGSGVRPVAG
jgi:Tol biopolymer transport system component